MTNNKSRHGAAAKPDTAKPIMALPKKLALNLDGMDFDLFTKFIDPETPFTEKKTIMEKIVVGGVGRYHVTLIMPLQIMIADELTRALGTGDEKKT